MTSVSIKDYKNAKKTDGKYISPYYDYDKTLSMLQEKKDMNLHLHLKADIPTMVFADVDKATQEQVEQVKNRLTSHFKIDPSQLSFTQTKTKDGLSLHLSIPSIKMNNIKELKEEIKKINTDNLFDTSVYKEGTFRLPYQTEKTKPHIHEIQQGKIEDFLHQSKLEKATTYLSSGYSVKPPKKKNEATEVAVVAEPKIKKTEDHKLADLIDISDIETYDVWLKLIWAVDIDLARYISQRSFKYNEEDFVRYFNDNKKGGINKATFYYYAKKGNEKKYKKIINKSQEIIVNLEDTDSSIGDFFVKHLGSNHIYCKGDSYYYNGLVWENNGKDAYRIKLDIMKILSVEYNNIIEHSKAKLDENTDEDKKDKLQKKIKFLQKLKKKCLNNGSINALSEVIKLKIADNDIKWEEKPYLYCFKNCIFDLEQNEFVKPVQEDYLTLSTEFNYTEPTEQELETVESVISQIFPIEEEKIFYMNVLYNGMVGITNHRFFLANGCGGNGKGLLNELFLSLQGGYGYIAPNNVILNPLKSGGNPEVANMNHKRFVLMREPSSSSGTKFNFGTIKELTGGAGLNARLNHSNKTEVRLKCLLMVECNTRPLLDVVIDKSVTRRLCDVLFRSTFTELHGKKTEEEYTFQKNDYYSTEQFKEKHRSALFRVILKYKSAKTLDELMPESIKKRTAEYCASSDSVNEFMNEHYIQTDDKNDIIQLKDIFEVYKRSDYYFNSDKKDKKTKKQLGEHLKTSEIFRKKWCDRVQIGTLNLRSCLRYYKEIPQDDGEMEYESD